VATVAATGAVGIAVVVVVAVLVVLAGRRSSGIWSPPEEGALDTSARLSWPKVRLPPLKKWGARRFAKRARR
jgi:hypothetical protein